MHSRLLPDDLWAEIQPLLPKPKRRRRRYPGRRPIDDRKIVTGILFVLKTGIPWDDLPAELGLGSGKTIKRRLAKWARIGVWTRLLAVLHARLNAAGMIDWSRALIDSEWSRDDQVARRAAALLAAQEAQDRRPP